jgi:hypothetical protein
MASAWGKTALGPIIARQFAVEYNVLAETYDDHASADKIIRVTDKRTEKPMAYGMKVSDLALAMGDEEAVYTEAFNAIAGKIMAQRLLEGIDPMTGAKPRDEYTYHGNFDDRDFPRVSLPKPVTPLVAERKKLVKYGRY